MFHLIVKEDMLNKKMHFIIKSNKRIEDIKLKLCEEYKIHTNPPTKKAIE